MIANSPEAWTERARMPTSHQAAMWSERGQQTRFSTVLAALDSQPGENLLDYGCGTGTLSLLVPDDVQYVGHDWAPGMIARARHDHPSRIFLPYVPVTGFDLIACVGPFNLTDGWSKTKTWATIEALWGRCGRALAVCLYAGSDPDCISYTEQETEEFAATLDLEIAPRIIRHLPNDILLHLQTGGHDE